MSQEAVQMASWAKWQGGAHPPYTLGVEEEIMMLNPQDWSLAYSIDYVLRTVTPRLARALTAETHGSAVELATSVHVGVDGAIDELAELRSQLKCELEPLALRVASLGTHPTANWYQTVVSSGERYQFLYGSMRELARREPTFALHIHVGVPDPEDAIALANRMRAHVPLLLAISVNSPYWQGRDTGLASTRTPLFQAFPRVGIPLAFNDYTEYVESIDLLIRCQCFPEPTFLWWDVRPQPRFGTVEIRVMDSQSTLATTASLVALVQSIAKLEIEEGYAGEKLVDSQEVLNENRFLAARDGLDAQLIDPDSETRVSARTVMADLIAACIPHAEELGCAQWLGPLEEQDFKTGSEQQRKLVRNGASLGELVAHLAGVFNA